MNTIDSRRRELKARCKRYMVGRRDRLSEGAAPRWRASFVLASLQACAMRAGWSHARIQNTVYPMAERIPACVLHGRSDAAALAVIDSWGTEQ